MTVIERQKPLGEDAVPGEMLVIRSSSASRLVQLLFATIPNPSVLHLLLIIVFLPGLMNGLLRLARPTQGEFRYATLTLARLLRSSSASLLMTRPVREKKKLVLSKEELRYLIPTSRPLSRLCLNLMCLSRRPVFVPSSDQKSQGHEGNLEGKVGWEGTNTWNQFCEERAFN